jgi:hypothetical protein
VNETLDVLLLENRPGAGEIEQAALEEAGHRVHRCHPAGDREFACVGIVDGGTCPLDGQIDVTLLVRRGVSPRPTPFEDGVRCAIRHGTPIVEHGSDALDPYAPWVAHRIALGETVASGCELTASRALEPLRDAIHDRIGPVIAAAGVSPENVVCDVTWQDDALVVHVTVPVAVEPNLEQAIAVRVLDAVRTSGRTFGQVGVQVHRHGTP